jgi:hypothetical protein
MVLKSKVQAGFGGYYTCILRKKPVTSALTNKMVKVPRNRSEGPEGGRGIPLLFPDLGTLEGGGWLAPRPGRFTLRKDPVPIEQEAGWASGPVWTCAKNLAPHRDSIPGPSSP